MSLEKIKNELEQVLNKLNALENIVDSITLQPRQILDSDMRAQIGCDNCHHSVVQMYCPQCQKWLCLSCRGTTENICLSCQQQKEVK